MRGGIAPPKLGQTWAEPSKLRDKVKAFWATGRSAPGLAFRPGLRGGTPAVPRGNDINHLDGGGKRDLFRRTHDVVAPGGRFVLGDVFVPEDPNDAQIEIDWVTDLPDRLDDQVRWLRAVGFRAEPVWAWKDLAVVVADR